MNLEALRFGSFTQLGEAVADWTGMIAKLESLKTDADTQLKKRAEKADWAGYNAKVTREFISKTALEFADAVTQATSIRNILQDCRNELIGYQGQLKDAIDRGLKKNLTVTSTGGGGFTVTMNIHPDRAAKGTSVPEHTPHDAENLRDEVERILKAATTSDSTAAQVLNALVDQTDHGFAGGKSYKDRDQAAKSMADAKDAADIYAKGTKATNTELARLNGYLKNNKNDPLFAESFAKSVGAEKGLSLYAAMANDQQFYVHPRSRQGLSDEQKERMKLLGALETELGNTFATATQSDSQGMDTWKKEMIAAGGKDVGTPSQHPVYGFQVMSNLMRHGTYEQDFLTDYGRELIAYEKENTKDEYGGLQRRVSREDVLPWDRSGGYEHLHFGADNDGGRDPMTGFMEALGHNAEASTEFLGSDSNFDYLTEGREWPEDHATQKANGIAGYDSLGHALESATKGAAYDANPPQLHRDADTAAVAEKVVERYGQDPEYKDNKQTGLSGAELLAKQEGIGDSLGRIGAAYIDDINWGMNGGHDKSLYALDNGGRANLGERAHFDNGDLGVTKFLSTLGQDPDAYADMGMAQQAYTTSLLETYPPKMVNGELESTFAETAIRQGAEVHGVLDKSRAEEIKADGAAADEKYNKAIDARVERDKMIAGLATGGMFSLMPSPASGVAATVVPIVSDGVEGITGGLIEANLDKYAEAHHRDNSGKYHADAGEVFTSGNKASWQSAYSLLERADASPAWSTNAFGDLSEALTRAQNVGYSNGSQRQVNVGALPTPS
ncbi:hypothetical protein HRW18_08470 [Streptomyces lunaelactis]|uniref:DUF6571 family protein n=1 Tax=Streptomyces lunaelactis TaxID=1535768 RepID=UPI0015847284|nr:DUF6571 family protein [Streptomyces lunaelactis]NUK08042.1 hypothetical protein [Streptomyces lunaelactis]NUK56525.1 hypothetical protein [Streptomyces lunaelactis]NUL09556.1 hypothetical protein [Streptomyces lunaelactis]NUL21594.1 hypothetical protein [Streptomyces lunaelactis]